MMTHVFPEEQRGMAMGLYGLIGMTFLSLGPLAGGFFSEFLSWRWIFWINPPIVAMIALVVLVAWRDPPRAEPTAKFDIPGLITLVAGLGMLVTAIMQGPDWGWSHLAVWLLLGGGVFVLAIFVVIEWRTPQPLIDVSLFRNGAFTTFNLTIFVAQFSKIAVFVFLALYLQNVLGFGALTAGFALLASTVPTLMTVFPTGKYLDRVGARVLVVSGAAAAAIATFWMGIAVTWNSYLFLLPALIVWAVCQSVLFAPSLRGVMNTVPADKRGQAGGISMTAQLLGGTIGLTICGTLFATTSVYWPIYLLVGCLFIGLFILSWATIKPHRQTGVS
jgi:MFS family permease